MSNGDPRATRGRLARTAILAAVILAGALAAQEQAPRPSIAGTGPMRELLARGVAAAPVTSGLTFALTIGSRMGYRGGPWSLRVPSALPLTLSLEEPSWDSGALEAVAHVRNGTGGIAGGLRLDFLEITDASSQRTTRKISLPSPLYIGDLPAGGEVSVPFRLELPELPEDSPYAVIRGIVTGVVATGAVEVAGSADPVAIDSDAQGTVYVGDGAAKALFRIAAGSRAIRKLEAGCPVTGVAVRRKSGEVFASCRDVPALLRLRPDGKITRTDPIDRPLGPIRFGGKGDLYGGPSTIVRLEALTIAEEIRETRQGPLQVSGFDAGPDGTIFAVTRAPDTMLLRIKSAKDVVALSGTGNGLGSIPSAITCRVGPDNLIYVLEAGAAGGPPRVSVFDNAGNLVRVWALPQGRPADLAFAADGRLEILWRRENAESSVSSFRTF